MSVFTSLLAWLEALAPLAAFAPNGICTAPAPASSQATLWDHGTAVQSYDISGRATYLQECVLVLRSAITDEPDRQIISALWATISAQCQSAAAQTLPQLPAPYLAQSLVCGPATCTQTNESGFGTWRATVLLTYTQERNDFS